MLQPLKMKKTTATTPFEDLILGSQFLPVLAHANGVKGENDVDRVIQTNVGIFQCRQCGATFLQEQEALTHYKFHVFESHKEYFSVVVGGSCPQTDCVFVRESSRPSVHFHCTFCTFSACEILDLPLHMEEGHLAFYKEVSLVLSGEDIQLNKVYKCGECSCQIQGKVSIVQHLLSHDPDPSSGTMDEPCSITMTNGKPSISPPSSPSMVNGLTNHKETLPDERVNVDFKELPEESNAIEYSPYSPQRGYGHSPQRGYGHSPHRGYDKGREDNRGYLKGISPFILNCVKGDLEQIQIEINPLDLISSLIEEDQMSDNPLLPMQHFLLGHSDPGVTEEEGCFIPCEEEETAPVNDYAEEEPMTEVTNGFNEVYYDQPPGVFQCNQCNEAFKYQYLLTAHRKQVHQGHVLTPFKCHVCGNEFTIITDLKRHMVTHSSEFTHFCQVCGHAFCDPLALKNHLVEHGKPRAKQEPTSKDSPVQSLVEKSAKCDSCAIEFPSKSELTRHIVKYQGTCNPNKSECVRCATCGDEMPSLDALKEHRKMSHPATEADTAKVGKKGFQCDYCGKTFSCRSNLRDHLVVHTGEKPYPCDICGKTFSFIHNMKTHRLTHNEGRNEMCPYCDKAYKSKISLYYHMKKGNCRGLSTKEVPEGFRRCTECLQMFASEERYQSHKEKGTCHMSYRCIHCGIRCSSQDKLDRHLLKGVCTKTSPSAAPQTEAAKKRRRRRRQDKEQRPEEPVCCERCNNYNRDCCCTFSCQVCGKRVFSIAAFTAHQRLHSSPAAAIRQRKERIRAAIMEKRRRRRRKEQYDANKIAKLEGLAAAKELADNFIPPSGNILPAEPKPEESAEAEASSLVVNPQEDEDSSNSGSLTDLSTFTAPNLLKPVHSTPAAAVGGGEG